MAPSTIVNARPSRGSTTASGCSSRMLLSAAQGLMVGAIPRAEPSGPPNSELVVMPIDFARE